MRSPIHVLAVLLALSTSAAAADLALVGAEEGHAILTHFRGNCYAIMPDHVANRDDLPLVTALPRTFGMAQVFERDPELDLALALVRGDVAAQCGRAWESLPRDLSGLLSTSPSAALTLIQFEGQFVERAAAELIDIDDGKFVAVVNDDWAKPEVMTGVSGAAMFVGQVPIGMVLSASETSRATALRMDSIVARLDPVLSGRARTPTQAQGSLAGGGAGISYQITGQVRLGADGAEGLDSAFHAEWTGDPVVLEFTLSEEAPVALTRILIQTDPGGDGAVTFPQRVRVSVDRGQPNSPYWTAIAAPDMNPMGQLEIRTGGTLARRVRVQVDSVWHADRPMRIEQVLFE